jgi:hypothetical protein
MTRGMTVDDRGFEELEPLVAPIAGEAAEARGAEAPVHRVIASVSPGPRDRFLAPSPRRA